MVKQKDAVFAAFEAATSQGLTGDAAHTFAVEQVKSGFMAGEIDHRAGRLDEKAASTYASSLVSNWAKKDDRLNGGAKYVPATKRGPQVKDDTLRTLATSLKSLKANNADMTLITRVEAAIEERRALVASQKAASKVPSLEETMAALSEFGITG